MHLKTIISKLSNKKLAVKYFLSKILKKKIKLRKKLQQNVQYKSIQILQNQFKNLNI